MYVFLQILWHADKNTIIEVKHHCLRMEFKLFRFKAELNPITAKLGLMCLFDAFFST